MMSYQKEGFSMKTINQTSTASDSGQN